MKITKRRSGKILQYFLQGLVISAPIAITLYLIVRVFSWLDNLLPIYINLGAEGEKPLYLPGLGFLLVTGLVLAIGYLSSLFVVDRAFHIFEGWVERTPGVKTIYTLIKDFSEALVGKKRKFTKPVLVSLIDPDIWQIGFITQEDIQEFGLKDHICVYVPFSYALTGSLYFVPRTKIKAVPDVSGPDAYKFAISGGIADVEE